jgi:ubiquinone/menaquinone biosynthesis C-methylase UbiE
MGSFEENRIWSEKIIRRWDPSFKHRWTLFEEAIRATLRPDSVWIDVGCGENYIVENLGSACRLSVGTDLLMPRRPTTAPFVRADLRHLPFRNSSADLVTLRFVVEHLANIPEDFAEVERILKPGGKLIILTTNAASPLIAIPHALLPYRLKNMILRTLFKVREDEIFPTHHRFNSWRRMNRGAGRLEPVTIELLQDANWVRRPIFLFYFAWHLLTKPAITRRLRTNIIATFRKRGEEGL